MGEKRVLLGFFLGSIALRPKSERIVIAVRIEVKEANTSTPERPLWVWNVFWGNREVGKGFSASEKEANREARLAVSRAPRRY